MRETDFIKQNGEKWKKLEKDLSTTNTSPQKLDDLYIQITDDLSYSRTFYPNRSVRLYLNGLAQSLNSRLYKANTSIGNNILVFWLQELPLAIYKAFPAFKIALATYVIAVLIGTLSAMMDPSFSEVILGEHYIATTLENIEKGDPMAIYKSGGLFDSFLGITLNNLQVSLLIFSFGVFFSIGSIAIIIRNGIMVGVFQYFFIARGLFWESFLTIWMHGTLEMSAMVIAGAGGITMGKGILFPKTYSRGKSFIMAARRGVQILTGVLPIIIIAGFIEGFITRHTDVSDVIRAAFILLCLLFVGFYYVFYPYWVANHSGYKDIQETPVSASLNDKISFKEIQKPSSILYSSFLLLQQNYKTLLGVITFFSILYSLVLNLFPTRNLLTNSLDFDNILFSTIISLSQVFGSNISWFTPIIIVIATSSLLATISHYTLKLDQAPPSSSWLQKTLKSIPFALFTTLIFSVNNLLAIVLFLFLGCYLLIANFISIKEDLTFGKALSRTAKITKKQYGLLLGVMALFMLVSYIILMLANSSLFYFFYEMVNWVFYSPDQDVMDTISIVVLSFVQAFINLMCLTLIISGIFISYYSFLEISEAKSLRNKIKRIGLKKNIKGLEKE